MASGWDIYIRHCGDDVIDALINEAGVVNSSMPLDESQNIFQSVLEKQSCSLASASFDHFFID